VAHAVAVNSATAGLHLAYEALGIGPGDEVLVPTWTFTATAEAVRYLGADPVFVDVDPRTWCLDLDAAAAAVTPRTKAVAPVHFARRAVPEPALAGLARSHGLRIVDDAAHVSPVRQPSWVATATTPLCPLLRHQDDHHR
jgi:dTDP-4-amino-4,6-dideoxygalactose transaminase